MTRSEIKRLEEQANSHFFGMVNALAAARDAGDSPANRQNLTTAKRAAYESAMAVSRLRPPLDVEERIRRALIEESS